MKEAIIFSLSFILLLFIGIFIILFIAKTLAKQTWKEFLDFQHKLHIQQNCKHEKWDCDISIRVIKCKNCGKQAWIDEYKDLFKFRT